MRWTVVSISDDVLSLDNSKFSYFVDIIYNIELAIKDTTDTTRYALYLNLHLEIDIKNETATKEMISTFPK